MKKLKLSHVPNVLTVFRICLVPIFVYLFAVVNHRVTAMAVFLLAGLTDVVDGIVARRFGWISDVGKLLDPFADKCMQMAVLICMVIGELIPLWVALILILKELTLFVGAVFTTGNKKIFLQAEWYGKVGAIAFYIITTLLVTLGDVSEMLRLTLGIVLVSVMLFALVMYILNYRKNIIRSNRVLEKK